MGKDYNSDFESHPTSKDVGFHGTNKRMPLTEFHWKGMFNPEKPIAPGLEDTGYVYALCQECFEEIKDEKTGLPHKTWQDIFKDDIVRIVTMEKYPRFNVKDSGLSEKEILVLEKFLMTGKGE
ncbi:hypothetical protein KKF82_07710 [Patescibacteria group bacterium]|nr:hypothetical protein [Patescibacteria group bacterium]